MEVPPTPFHFSGANGGEYNIVGVHNDTSIKKEFPGPVNAILQKSLPKVLKQNIVVIIKMLNIHVF